MTSQLKTEDEVDVHKLLERRHQIAIIWSIEDVQELRPDLNDDQCWQVLQRCDRVHDCNYGFTWDLIQYVADDLFPDTKEGDGQ